MFLPPFSCDVDVQEHRCLEDRRQKARDHVEETMRTRTVNYFLGSLFSRQALYAYGIAGGITTAGQLLLVWLDVFSSVPQRTEMLPVVVEIYIETLLPLWIPPITGWNILIFLINIVLGLWILASWTVNYGRSF